ncbi:hypothetical protein H4R27_000461 [Coemansia aciculifera]|nr:hypothetical protein H4R27_000461 [Coemansia aciculifera]
MANPAQTPMSRTTHSSVVISQHLVSPQNRPGLNEYRENNKLPSKVIERRERLAKALERLGTPLEFPELVEELGLTTEYGDYEKATGGLFAEIIDRVPTLSNAAQEATFVEEFFGVLALMCVQAGKSSLPEQYSRKLHESFDGQKTSLSGTELKPDILFIPALTLSNAFSNVSMVLEAKKWTSDADAYLTHIGQLADYALELRACQPTRRYIPVFFLYGHKLDLIIFTHRGYFRTYIGPVLFRTDDHNREITSDNIGKSLRQLWFFMTLPVDRCGFLFRSPKVPTRWRLDTTTVPAAITSLDGQPKEATGFGSQDTDVLVGDPISRPVRIAGRCTYLFNATYKGKAAVTKLSWIPTNRMPEGAVYRVLEGHGVPNLPKVHKSGIIIKNFDGYRLEFLVMEYCGISVVDYIRGLLGDTKTTSDAAPQATIYVRQVVSTLTAALAANVLHRDVSGGNIAIKAGNAYVIDWGYAKVLKKPDDEAFAQQLATYWAFDWDEVIPTEGLKDPFTGTPLYMSARLLLGAKMRGIYDDLESLMYVVLDAFSDRPRAGDSGEQPLGFTFLSSATTACTRITCTLSGKCFLDFFGVKSVNTSVAKELLMTMRRFLFFDDGEHIGARILENADFPRVFDELAALAFMGEANMKSIKSMVTTQAAQSPLLLDTAASVAPVPSALRIAHAPAPWVTSAQQGMLDDDSGLCGTRVGGSRPMPGTPTPLGRGFSTNQMLVGPSNRSSSLQRNVLPFASVSPLMYEARSSTSAPRPLLAAGEAAAQAGPSRVTTSPTPLGTDAMSVGDLSIEDRKGKGVDTAAPNMHSSDMEIEHADLAQASISNPPSGSSARARGPRNVNPPTTSPPRTRSQAKALLSKRGGSTKENDVPVGNKKANIREPSTGAKKRANDNSHQSATQKAARHTKKPTLK